MIYINEIDPYCAQWLQNLMDADILPRGHIDTRSIEDVTPDDLAGYTQHHFFAGLGGWIYALDLAGWPRDRPVWTGSCPCQPFSSAGKSSGFADERHLWPAWHHLIAQQKPSTIFGEQVASKVADDWIDLVHADMEGMGYAFGCIPFPSAGVGAPHIRDRLFWVGHTDEPGPQGHAGHGGAARWQGSSGSAATASVSGGVADASSVRCGCGDACAAIQEGRQARPNARRELAAGSEGRPLPGGVGTALRVDRSELLPGPTNGFWGTADWLCCRNGKWRPVEPGTFPLAHGIPSRVGRLRAYGNAIVPQAAAEFIYAAMSSDVRQRLAAA